MTEERAPHPGKILEKQFLEPLGVSKEALAFAIASGASRAPTETALKSALQRVEDLIAGRRRIVTATATLLSVIFKTKKDFWLDAQKAFDSKKMVPRVPSGASKSDANKLRDQALRNKALELVDSGLTSDAVGDQLSVKKMTVAGWRAARTKGSYDNE